MNIITRRAALLILAALLAVRSLSAPARAASPDPAPLGVRVPEGFEVTLFAADDLAHDIFSLSIDSLGRVVVSGPSYVRILIDRDGDGRADSFRQYADGPKSGSQGMCFDGRDLICTGDDGLWRYRDANADDRADGPPVKLLNIKASGEHHAHSVQRGPDGWWYVMAGNMAGVTEKDVTLPTSPVRRPRAGTLLRLKPDFSGREVVAHGFRNAYDFAFNAQGDVFTYDSDGEREVSLPWYRPTRVFHLLPGSDAGWVSETWKHPDYYPDMPPVIASLGRGSPTGVLCYRHEQFPAEYRGALLVADWTFGRIVALPLTRDGETWKSTPKDFMTGSGTFGFAPTDMEVAPDGSMYVSVGGRGTRGGVYRVRYKNGPASGKRQLPGEPAKTPATKADELTACLSMPQPLAAWSRAQWLPLAKKLGRESLQAAALDEKRPVAQRLRAMEAIVELYGALSDASLRRFAWERNSDVRGCAAWAIGRARHPAQLQRVAPIVLFRDDEPQHEEFEWSQPFDRSTAGEVTMALDSFLSADDPAISRRALEALLSLDHEPFIRRLARHLASRRFVAAAASRIVARFDNMRTDLRLATGIEAIDRRLAGAAIGWTKLGYANNSRLPVRSVILRRYDKISIESRQTWLRAAAIDAGDFGPGKHPAAFDGYSMRSPPAGRARHHVISAFPSGDEQLDKEISRIGAMVSDDVDALFNPVLNKLTDQSHPTDDVHYLLVAARIEAKRTDAHTERVAKALLQLDEKVARLKLPIDTNWEPSLSAMYEELVKRDVALPWDIVQHPKFGRAEHVLFTKNLPPELLPKAIATFARRIEKDDEFPVSAEMLFLLGKAGDVKGADAKTGANPHAGLIRRLHDERMAVRGPALIVLAKTADAADRGRFVAGLDAAEPEVLTACLDALGKLPPAKEAKEQVALVRSLRRLSGSEGEYALRDKAAGLLHRTWGDESPAGFISGKPGHRPQPQTVNQWTDFIRGKFAAEFAKQTGHGVTGPHGDTAAVKAALAQADWSQGDAARGAKLFEARSCSRCHSGRTALGPDLAGATRRFSRDDLFTAIVEPSRDVSPRYQATMIQTTDGQTFSGLVIYESVDGVTLRDGLNQTLRIAGDRIAAQQKQAASIMPAGLLKDAKSSDLADLYAYLQGLGK